MKIAHSNLLNCWLIVEIPGCPPQHPYRTKSEASMDLRGIKRWLAKVSRENRRKKK